MSIQTYNRAVLFDDREVACGSAVPNLTKEGITMDFMISIMTTIGRDKTRARSTTFTIVGDLGEGGFQQNNTYVSDIIDAGARMASNIADFSKGILSGFYAKLGKFRPDECPVDVPAGDNSRCIIDLTNNYNEEYGINPCDASDENPVVPASYRLYIPWLRDDVSRQDIISSLTDWSFVKNGVTYSLGTNKFRNDQKNQIACYPTPVVRNIMVSNYSRRVPSYLQNNDSALGWDDNVVSEEFNTNLDDGKDDRA